MNLTSIARAPQAQRRHLALDGDQVGEVDVRPARDLIQVRADARDLPCARALDLARRRLYRDTLM